MGARDKFAASESMACSPITLWQIHGTTMETRDFIFLGSKITADGDCSHEIKRCLLLGRKSKATGEQSQESYKLSAAH